MISYSDKLAIEKYYNLDEGFKKVRPDLCQACNVVTSFHIAQLEYHRKALEKWLEDNVDYGDLGYEED
ncbi:hypothetical protein VPHG_00076 [Vibrio phage 11895-B1]|uniref:hypothetical protein n=1 Tax=Vibrio phage 11895-B1 TaxID=754075 RepID=UPI0002C0DAD3|nr:hypothetical protein VPHG_00076 [Vibrio phage 11895-B1]AGH32143.1 hypothetical protein VPHG_00076 [Vibrio phage 11895-B1]